MALKLPDTPDHCLATP